MNVRMMPPQGPMGQPMPMGGAPAPMPPQGGPMMPPAPTTPQSQQGKGLGSAFGGSVQGRQGFKQFMAAKKQTSAMVPQVAQAQMPRPSPVQAPQPMLPAPNPQMMGAMRPMGGAQASMPVQAGRPMRGTQGGLGSAPVQLNMGGVVPQLSMDMAADGPAVYLGDQRLSDPADFHQKMLRAGYGRDAILDSASNIRDAAMHIVEDTDEYLGGARSGFGHVHEFNEGGKVPRQTEIMGQPHYLAYINPEEGELLKGLGGAGTPGPGGIPSYWLHTSEARSSWGGGSTTTTSNNDNNNNNNSSNNTIGQVSSTGQYAGDGFEWKDSGSGYLTRTYTGVGKDNNLGTDVIAGGTADKSTKEAIASVSLNEGSNFANTAGSATDTNIFTGTGSSSYADQVGATSQPVSTGTLIDLSGADLDLGTFGGAGIDVGVPGIDTSYASGKMDADLGVGAINTGDTYSGSDSVVSGGFDFGNNNDVTVSTGSSGYPSLDATAGVNTNTSVSTSSDDDDDYYEPVGFDFDNDGISGEGSDVLDNNTSNPFVDVDASDTNVIPTTDSSDDSYTYTGSDETDFSQPVVNTTPSPPPPPPKYYDMFGGEHSTQAAADAADAKYKAEAVAAEAVEFVSQPVTDGGYTQADIDASNNTAKLMNDYSTISDDYSNFQGFDLTKESGNTIGYATGGSKAGYAATINAATGQIEILTPGSQEVEKVFEATELEDALNYLTDGDVNLTNLDAPLDLLPEASGGTGTVGLDAEGRVIEYGVDDIEEMLEALEGVSDMTDEELAEIAGDIPTTGTVDTSTLEGILEASGIEDGGLETASAEFPTGPFREPEETGLESMEQELASDFMEDMTPFEKSEIESLVEDYYTTGAGQDGYNFEDEIASELDVPAYMDSISDQASDLNALDLIAEELAGDSTSTILPDDEEDVIFGGEDDQQTSTTTTASQDYLSAMKKLDDPNSMTEAEQRALYGARGQVPNAAETAYLQSLLGNAKHKEDGPIGADGEPIYKAGDYVTEQSLGDMFEDALIFGLDTFVNPVSFLGDKFTLEGQQDAYIQEQLDAYKNGGTFVYGEDGKTVIGVAKPNYDADNDGVNDTVVLNNENNDFSSGDDDIIVTSDGISVDDVKINDDVDGENEDDDIEIVYSDTTFENTEDGVVETNVGGTDTQTGGDDPCNDGYYLDPTTNACTPLDGVGTEEGDAEAARITLRLRDITRGGGDVTLPTPTPVEGEALTIRKPAQFNDGGPVEMQDMSVGKNESLGNDMVMLTFADGTKRQTQKALYEAAQDLGALDNMQSGDDFANWHLNEWAGKVVSDPTYKAAHDTFNTNQIAYNNALMDANPEIAQNRLSFTQQYAPDNQAAIDAAQALVDQYSGVSSNNSGNVAVESDDVSIDPVDSTYIDEYPAYDVASDQVYSDVDADINDIDSAIGELNIPVAPMIIRKPAQFFEGGGVYGPDSDYNDVDRYYRSSGDQGYIVSDYGPGYSTYQLGEGEDPAALMNYLDNQDDYQVYKDTAPADSMDDGSAFLGLSSRSSPATQGQEGQVSYMDDLIDSQKPEPVIEPDPIEPMIIRAPMQFAQGGMVTPNIDRFLQSLGA